MSEIIANGEEEGERSVGVGFKEPDLLGGVIGVGRGLGFG